MYKNSVSLWIAFLSTLVFILTLIVYTTVKTISVELQFTVNSTPISYMEEPAVEKYITYYPHSGLHSQRISLINAIIIAKALNRTLIVPEMSIGKAIPWNPSKRLERMMSMCPGHSNTGSVCYIFRDYISLPTEAIFDLSFARHNGVLLVARANMSLSYFEDVWSATEQDIYHIRESTRFSYRIFDRKDNHDTLYNFTRRIDIQDLATVEERFIVFGSVFYENRLSLSDPELVLFAHHLHGETVLNHPIVTQQALKIISLFGGPNHFVGAHLRQGDGIFKKFQNHTESAIKLGLGQDIIPRAEYNPTRPPAPSNRSLTSQETDMLKNLQGIKDVTTLLTQCLTIHHADNHPRFRLIYLATDASHPRDTLKDLHIEFPCLFTLSDFPEIVQQALMAQPIPIGNDWVDCESARLGTQVNSFLIPMIDAEVASHASAFVGTSRSTFSAYIIYRVNHLQSLYAT
ncbi:unnamed protein product [Rhizopus stolonifer]